MSLVYRLSSCLFGVASLCSLQPAWAHSGPAIVAHPVSDITVDGDLSDWPEDGIERQPLVHFDFEVSAKPEKADASGWFATGFDPKTNSLFVAMQIKDDQLVTERMSSRLPNGLGTNPDGVLLYLDVRHGPGFVEKMEFSFVSRAIAAADNRLLPEGIVAQSRKLGDGQMTAEWRIDLVRLFEQQGLDASAIGKQNLVLGFDAVYFDRDADEDGSIIKWTLGPNDGQENRDLGDLFILPDGGKLVRVEGKTQWADSEDRPPVFARLVANDNPGLEVFATSHPDGLFHAKVPAGPYQIEAGDSRSVWESKQEQDLVVRNDPIKIAKPITGKIATGPLEDWVPSYMKTYGLRTAGVAVIENGDISYLKTFGKEADGDPANDDTRFRVASITKPITTMTLMRQVEMGLWDLDTQLSQYWVEPDLKDDLRHEALTTRLAFRHLTGLPNWRRRPGLNFLYEPGTIQSYSGEGFQYARRAVEAATGKTLEDLARTNVFDPAGMTDTSYQWSDSKAHRFAGEYFGSGVQVNHYKGDGINAAANLLSTPSDLARFAQWMMAEYDRQPDWWAEMTTPNGDAVIDPASQAPERFGLGWSVHKRDGVTVIEHSGGQNGIRTHLIIIPEQKKALVVLTNSSSGWSFIRSIFDATLNRKGELAETGNALYGDIKF